MAIVRGNSEAFGQPGKEPGWTHGDKDGVGAAYSAPSQLWFTVWNGIVTELYFPTVDQPQLRDMQFLITDGKSFFHEEKTRSVDSKIESLDGALGYRVVAKGAGGEYEFEKTIIADPHLSCLLQRIRFKHKIQGLKLYALCAPHLEVGGWGNNASVMLIPGHEVLVAQKGSLWLAMGSTLPFSRTSVGFVGESDGYTDLADGYQFDWQFDTATDGNVALTGEIELDRLQEGAEFTIGIAFGNTLPRALTTLLQSISIPFDKQAQRYIEQWSRAGEDLLPLAEQSRDSGHLFRTSVQLLLAHEDKTYPGALIASLAIPWGQARGDEEGRGGYHLVWTRDMVQSALGLVAAGQTETPLRALIYLAASQREDGGFPQNFWVDGRPYWTGVQLDEVAFPILLAYRLWKENALANADPLEMLRAAARFLLRSGPITEQERWEEAVGLSPSTLAICIASLVCAADFFEQRGDRPAAALVSSYADWLESNLERWTVTESGTLLPNVKRHYVRVHPKQVGEAPPAEGLGEETIKLTSQPDGQQSDFPAKEIVDAGFLELVRYGIRDAVDPLIVDSVKVIDAVLKVETPSGTCWRRYNNDGYGQRADGGPYLQSGQGRAWPLLAGERAHYELAAGRDPEPLIRSMEGLATPTALLPEQVWDEDDRPDHHLRKGRPTGSAVPLLWAHAEYIKVLRSVRDGRVFDRVDKVQQRYVTQRSADPVPCFWSFLYPSLVVRRGQTLRIIATAPFRLRWSGDGWNTQTETEAEMTSLRVASVDIVTGADWKGPVSFTFFWNEPQRWEGRDYSVALGD